MKNIFQIVSSFAKHLFAIIATGVIVFIAYDKLKANTESPREIATFPERSSITFVNGKYKVDTMVIRNDFNKKRLITDLEKQILEEKKTIQEVPSFIWRFLDNISSDKKFDIVNPGEDYKEGIMDYGHVVFKKIYDANKKDSVSVISGDGAVLANKQLVYLGMNETIVLMTYMHGGLGPHPNILIMKHNNNKVTDFWFGSAWNDGIITSKNEIIKTLKSKRSNGC
jgi:hypothetical protein